MPDRTRNVKSGRRVVFFISIRRAISSAVKGPSLRNMETKRSCLSVSCIAHLSFILHVISFYLTSHCENPSSLCYFIAGIIILFPSQFSPVHHKRQTRRLPFVDAMTIQAFFPQGNLLLLCSRRNRVLHRLRYSFLLPSFFLRIFHRCRNPHFSWDVPLQSSPCL